MLTLTRIRIPILTRMRIPTRTPMRVPIRITPLDAISFPP